ncbi:MAG: DNA topoisomerase IV subunit A [Alphaproteobacteria bacterium]|nr:DNA topoisomerase IV subunit A [Alphaproteobacteria bacterium]
MAKRTAKAAAPPPEDIRPTPLAEALSERYLAYALSTIMARSLPDVRDGLKPVHRRLLYAMRQLRLDPESGFKKCARVVGDVIGKFHPHGDVAVYDAMVRLGQDFAVRYPLVDGQGNFGNIDGDNAAAMRYTEARLTAVAQALLDGIDENAVDFRPTYDGEDAEPTVLPARFPNLLANGAAGIAVGMATSIPPHNVGELCDALLHLIKTPKAHPSTLADMIPGPDFPTGGVLVEPRESVVEAYKTGRGSFRLRARWAEEKLGHGTWQIVVTEIPWQVQKSRLIERIAELLQAKKLPLLADIRDESTEKVRIVLEPKNRSVEPQVLMEHMFRQTEMETRVSLNMNVLDADNTPRVMGLREVLQAFLDHRHEVLIRCAKFRQGKIEARLEILDGFLIAYLNLDKVIRIIRTEDEPKPKLIKAFKLTDNQAEAILNMRLRQLRKLEEMEIKGEHKQLSGELAELKSLLKSEDKRWKKIAAEVADIRTRFGAKTDLGRRRTEIGDAPTVEAAPIEAFVEREPITVVCSEKGWVRAIKGHMTDFDELKFKEGDGPGFAVHAQTTDKILFFASNGRFYTIIGDKLPGGRGHGEPIRLMVELGNDHDIIAVLPFVGGRKLIVASDAGRGFVMPEDEALAQTRNGRQVLNLGEKDRAAACAVVGQGADAVAIVGTKGKLLIFPLAELPEMTRGRGVILQRYKEGGLSDVTGLKLKEGLVWKTREQTRSEPAIKDWVGKRGQAGMLPFKGFPTSRKFNVG